MSERKENTGRAYWKSLEEQANTPEFRTRIEREFPALAMDLENAPPGPSRRRFLQLAAASLALAGMGGLAGCRRDDHRLMPYQTKSAEQVPGNSVYYATTFVMAGVPMGVLVETVDGRPIKIEGNPNHPNSGGATNAWAQASILDLYDPDRSRVPLKDGKPVRMKEDVLPYLDNLAKELKATRGKGLVVLSEKLSSPAMGMLRDRLKQELPDSDWHEYEPLAHGLPEASANELAVADVVLSLDCDFLGTEDHGVVCKRAFASRRSVDDSRHAMNRLYVAEPSLTLTGAAADHRLSLASIAITELAILLARELLPADASDASIRNYSPANSIDREWVAAVAADLRRAGKQGLILVGRRQSGLLRFQNMARNMLAGLPAESGNDRPLTLADFDPNTFGPLESVASAIEQGQISTLLIINCNPAYSAAGNNFDALLARVPTKIHLGLYADETAEKCNWHIPTLHWLESWGDAESNNLYSPVQPVVEPLFDSVNALEVLARLAGHRTKDSYTIVQESFQRTGLREPWRVYLNRGVLRNDALGVVERRLYGRMISPEPPRAQRGSASASHLEVSFAASPSVFDGRFANNGWLQEMPDPITTLTWDNAALISPKLAEAKKLATGDVVTIAVNGRSLEAPVMVMPGQADWSITLPLGYGRTRAGSLGTGVGFNAYKLRTSDSPGFAVGATITKTGKTYPLATTQEHWSFAEHHLLDEQLKKRAIIREGTLQEYRKEPTFAKEMGEAHAPTKDDIYTNPLAAFKKDPALHQWAMAIDMSACVGCSACVIACQAENNVPIVGKDEVIRGREMHWLRIDRYFSGDLKPSPLEGEGGVHRTPGEGRSSEGKSGLTTTDGAGGSGSQPSPAGSSEPLPSPFQGEGKIRVHMQPMLCQHCEAAPCEPVCPVNATVHDSEGLNAMVYNRCIGTRYCSNNCPYKVRRFNYFDWNKGTLRESGKAPFDGTIQPDPTKGWSQPQMRQPPLQELLVMQKNPEVTVRMRGVMEKCTFCVQRIESAKIAQRVAAGEHSPTKVPDGTIQTACQQSCPTQAIVFGDGADPNSRVAKLRASARSYDVLGHLNTKPRVGYLARIRNPNPALEDG